MVEIEMNTSVLPDEYIAHRLGMIPLISSNCDETIRYTRVCSLSFRPHLQYIPIIGLGLQLPRGLRHLFHYPAAKCCLSGGPNDGDYK